MATKVKSTTKLRPPGDGIVVRAIEREEVTRWQRTKAKAQREVGWGGQDKKEVKNVLEKETS